LTSARPPTPSRWKRPVPTQACSLLYTLAHIVADCLAGHDGLLLGHRTAHSSFPPRFFNKRWEVAMSCVFGLYALLGVGLYAGYRHWGTPLRMLYAALLPLHWAVIAVARGLPRHGKAVGVGCVRVACAAVIGGFCLVVAVVCCLSGDVIFAVGMGGFGVMAAWSLLTEGVTKRGRLL
jgi:hypothetical protein